MERMPDELSGQQQGSSRADRWRRHGSRELSYVVYWHAAAANHEQVWKNSWYPNTVGSRSGARVTW
jgi:hypothetical protein